MRFFLTLAMIMIVLFAGCGSGQTVDGPGTVNSYTQIDQETAKQMMELDDGHVLVDVRRQDEYDAGHIPGAILIPNESIGGERPAELPDLNQVILIYCRSGNRSKQAAQKLFDMGYTQIYEFGGINTWTGGIVTEEDMDTFVKSAPVLVIEAGGTQFCAVLEDNSSAEALIDGLNSGPIAVEMRDYGGFEKVGPLPWTLPRNDTEITTKPGDVILYQRNQITVYYDQNTWSFTRLAVIGDVTKEELLEAFGEGNVTVRFWLEWGE